MDKRPFYDKGYFSFGCRSLDISIGEHNEQTLLFDCRLK